MMKAIIKSLKKIKCYESEKNAFSYDKLIQQSNMSKYELRLKIREMYRVF